MASENVRERKEKRHFTVVFISGTDSRQTRTFSASLWKLIGIFGSAIVVLAALVTAAIVYTPIGSRLPIANPRLENEYGRQIQDIQERMGVLFDQLNTLRAYNIRLRKALGEQLSPVDSGLIASGKVDTSAPAGSARAPERGEAPLIGAAGSGDRMGDGPDGGMTASQGGPIAMATDGGGDGREIFPLSQPTVGFVTREFLPGDYHYGMDFAAKEGTPVLAAAPGFVIFAGWTAGDGNMLMISHARGFVTVYKHNKSLLKSVGDAVRRGEMVASVGNTGRSTAPHLHFEVWKDGIAQNAGDYLLTTP
jgi:murein DD-endopeptidase MepM/ murein hydrolase activator NlpD